MSHGDDSRLEDRVPWKKQFYWGHSEGIQPQRAAHWASGNNFFFHIAKIEYKIDTSGIITSARNVLRIKQLYSIVLC